MRKCITSRLIYSRYLCANDDIVFENYAKKRDKPMLIFKIINPYVFVIISKIRVIHVPYDFSILIQNREMNLFVISFFCSYFFFYIA